MGVTGNGSMNLYIPQGCLEFIDVNHDSVVIPQSSILEPSDKLTISIWFCAPSQGFGSSIISNNGDYELIVGLNNKYCFAIDNSNLASSDIKLNDNTWHHLVGTYDSSLGSDNIKLYIDGELDSVGTYSNQISYTSNPLTIGSRGASRYWDGKICESRFYSGSTLTSNEVKLLYNGTYSTTTNLVGHWKFNDKEGSILGDSSINSHDGTINGPTWEDRDIRCWNSRWDEGNWNVTIETFVDACDRNYLLDNIIPAAVGELYNILGVPTNIDLTYGSSNTLIYEPIHPYGLSGLVEKRTIGVKSINDTFINNKLFGIKIEGIRLDTE